MAYFQGTQQHIDEVTIRPSGDAAGRNNGTHPLDDDCSAREIAKAVIELYAGYAAEVRFDPTRNEAARATAGSDDEHAEEWLRWMEKNSPKRREIEERLRLEAAGLVQEHWSAVAALARELVEHTTIDAYEAAWIVAIAEGEQAKVDLAEYRRRKPRGA